MLKEVYCSRVLDFNEGSYISKLETLVILKSIEYFRYFEAKLLIIGLIPF